MGRGIKRKLHSTLTRELTDKEKTFGTPLIFYRKTI
jgi:hypothetical protein